ncbi:MAG: class I SAM-dependent RNA methyltransferase [Treponema sp.]|nr:class I SAM-dependent RNA methyltransferase [Treponema sp.]
MEETDAGYTAVALCAVGAEKAVSNEVKKLGLAVTDSGFGRVRFRVDTAGLYRSLMALRAADRVLLETASFSAADFDALFEGTEAVAWEQMIPAQMGLKVAKVRSNRSRLKAETSIQSVVHKAAAQRLCRAHGLARLPDTSGTTAEIRVYVEKDMVSLLLDLSGEPLFKRGYRKEGGIAPLRETTAAAMLLLSGWKRKYPLYDPFCGSGTILTEAFMYAWDMAPGLGRNFALNDLLIADNKIEETVRNELRGKVNFERTIRIAGSDEDASVAALAIVNLKRARDLSGLTAQNRQEEPYPLVRTLPLRGAQPPFAAAAENAPADGPCGFIVTNPPYGKRLGDQAASERLYGEMGTLGRHFSQWKLALITDHPGFESFFGRKAHSCREIQGGPIPAYFFQYEGL